MHRTRATALRCIGTSATPPRSTLLLLRTPVCLLLLRSSTACSRGCTTPSQTPRRPPRPPSSLPAPLPRRPTPTSTRSRRAPSTRPQPRAPAQARPPAPTLPTPWARRRATPRPPPRGPTAPPCRGRRGSCTSTRRRRHPAAFARPSWPPRPRRPPRSPARCHPFHRRCALALHTTRACIRTWPFYVLWGPGADVFAPWLACLAVLAGGREVQPCWKCRCWRGGGGSRWRGGRQVDGQVLEHERQRPAGGCACTARMCVGLGARGSFSRATANQRWGAWSQRTRLHHQALTGRSTLSQSRWRVLCGCCTQAANTLLELAYCAPHPALCAGQVCAAGGCVEGWAGACSGRLSLPPRAGRSSADSPSLRQVLAAGCPSSVRRLCGAAASSSRPGACFRHQRTKLLLRRWRCASRRAPASTGSPARFPGAAATWCRGATPW